MNQCFQFNFYNPGSCFDDCKKSISVSVPPGTVSPFGVVVGKESLTCSACEIIKEATCEDFGENSSPECPLGYFSEQINHFVGEISPVGSSVCSEHLRCSKCVDPVEASLCAQFGFADFETSCSSCEKKTVVSVPPGTVSPFGVTVGEAGLVCSACEIIKEATCEDFGENSSPECPLGYVSERVLHIKENSYSNISLCEKTLICFKCNPPYIY